MDFAPWARVRRGIGLTYISTSAYDGLCITLGAIGLAPLVSKAGHLKRAIWISKEVADVLDGRSDVSFPSGVAASQNDVFLRGHLVTVGSDDKRAQLKKVSGSKFVWFIAYRKPKPGWRMFGFFIEKDVFVGLFLEKRTTLSGGRSFDAVAQEVERWAVANLSGIDPIGSGDFKDCISDLYWDLDDDL